MFIPCRFGVMAFVIIWTIVHKAAFASPYYEVVVYSTSIIALLNAGLFCRLYRSDILRQNHHPSNGIKQQPKHDINCNGDVTPSDEVIDDDIKKNE